MCNNLLRESGSRGVKLNQRILCCVHLTSTGLTFGNNEERMKEREDPLDQQRAIPVHELQSTRKLTVGVLEQ